MDTVGVIAQYPAFFESSFIVSKDFPVSSLNLLNDTIKPNNSDENIIQDIEHIYATEFENKQELHEVEDEFCRKVKERKRKGFTGNEFSVQEAVHKQFGPSAVEARAFLEYYWETKARCLEAVEKGRDEDVENFKMHPLFSPYWLTPAKRDLRWHMQNEIENNKIQRSRVKGGKSKIPVRIRGPEIKKYPPDESLEKRFITTRNFQNIERKNRFKAEVPVIKVRKAKGKPKAVKM